MSLPDNGIYQGTVRHRRLRPKHHALTYRVFSLLIDLDRPPRLRFFSRNRFNILSLFDKDHGDGKTPLAQWVRDRVRDAGVTGDLRIRMLCYPRLWGFVFNPLTIYFCERPDGETAAILYEVNNTFGQRHCYLFRLDQNGPDRCGVLRHSCDKEFYVSPFIPMEMRYHFRIKPPGDKVAIAIHETDRDGAFLHASFTGRHAGLTDRAILSAVSRHPLMTLKIVAGIHWEALRLWRKGAVFQHRPDPPAQLVRILNVATGKQPATEKTTRL